MPKITPLSALRQWLENPGFRKALLADEKKVHAILTDASEPECVVAMEQALLEEDARIAELESKPAWMREFEAEVETTTAKKTPKKPAPKMVPVKTPFKKNAKKEPVITVKLSVVKPHSIRAFLKGKERGTSSKTVAIERHSDGVLEARTLHGKHEAADFARLTRAELDTLL